MIDKKTKRIKITKNSFQKEFSTRRYEHFKFWDLLTPTSIISYLSFLSPKKTSLGMFD